MLLDLQKRFAAALVAGDAGQDDAAAALLVERGLARTRRVGIYRYNVQHNLRNALEETYPATRQAVGAPLFRALAQRYLLTVPSRTADLNDFGEAWPEMLAELLAAPDSDFAQQPWLADLSRLERAWHDCFHAAESAPLDVKRLAALDADAHLGLCFQLAPSVRLLRSAYPLFACWQHHQAESAPAWTSPDSSGDAIVLVREGAEVTVRCVPLAGYILLTTIAAKATFGEAVDAAMAEDSEFDLQGFFALAVQSGVIVDFTLGTS